MIKKNVLLTFFGNLKSIITFKIVLKVYDDIFFLVKFKLFVPFLFLSKNTNGRLGYIQRILFRNRPPLHGIIIVRNLRGSKVSRVFVSCEFALVIFRPAHVVTISLVHEHTRSRIKPLGNVCRFSQVPTPTAW